MPPPTAHSAQPVEDDERLLRVVESYDEYLSNQQHVIELLKQAFLKLTMAKMNLAAQTVGENSYREEFQSALRVTSEANDSFTVVKASATELDQASSQSDTGLRSRKGNETMMQWEGTTKSDSRTLSTVDEDAAIMWFSSLPPQNLRIAQKNFRNALHAIVASASCARQIQQALKEPASHTIAPTHT